MSAGPVIPPYSADPRSVMRANDCWLVSALVGCGTSGPGTSGPAADLPMISPPVRAATPAGLKSQAARRVVTGAAELPASELRDRFFSGAGPTDLMTLLASVDQRLTEINGTDRHPDCLDQAPISYTITPAGHPVELVAQCYRQLTSAQPGDPAFVQFGERDGETSLYVAIGAARLAALIAPIAGSTDHTVEAWYGVGYNNATSCGSAGAFDDCSYALAELHANPASTSFEMAVAGIGVGFCGVQFASDGAALWSVGSTDMGATCNARATACVSATDLDTPTSCGAPSYNLPALGRRAGAGAHEFGASDYPDEPNLTLDGTGSDSLRFGPTAPTAGAGNFDAGK
jgi:hypothetical protein